MVERIRDNAILISILVGLLMFSLGFGASQLTMAGDVRENTTNIRNIDSKFEKIIGLMEKQIEQNNILIAKLEVQGKK